MPLLPPSLDGPPLRLPAVLDELVDRWVAIPPRIRAAATLFAIVAVMGAASSLAGRSPAGPPVDVWVATRDIAAGDLVDGAAASLQSRPRDHVPSGALTDPPAGFATATIPAGAILAIAHVTDGGVAATVAHGFVAVPVPYDVLPALAAGTRLDIVGADGNGTVRTLASDALVLGTDAAHTWLQVARDDAGAVASAAAVSRLAVAVLAR